MKNGKMKAISVIMVFAMVFTVFMIPGVSEASDAQTSAAGNEITVPGMWSPGTVS